MATDFPGSTSGPPLFGDLLDHLERSTNLGRAQAARVVAEVLTYFSDTTETYVRRRHAELVRAGRRNPQIFDQIGRELGSWRVRPPRLSERQIRRIIYG